MTEMQALLEKITKKEDHRDERRRDTKPRALVYLRVSTQMQDDKGLSIPQQRREIEEYAGRNSIDIAGEYHDASSAYQNEDKRTEFKRMVEKAKSDPTISMIIVHEYSRFSRNFAHAMALIPELKAAGVEVVSATEPIIDLGTTSGLFMGAFTHASNEVTSRKISEHVKKGCKANIQTRDAATGRCYKNGGRPLWGYREVYLERGKVFSGRPQFKKVWELDDTVVVGKPLHEWVRECLERAAAGASSSDLRDFCNEKGIPGRREQYWSHHSWKELLSLKSLLQYAGFGVWGVRKRGQRQSPVSDWTIVEDAHPAIITEEQAMLIYEFTQKRRESMQARLAGRTRSSKYLLTGGAFKCTRCGKNMISHRTNDGDFYVCSTARYRSGLGCGQGVYIPREKVEPEVISGIEGMFTHILEHTKLVEKVNRELREMWDRESGFDPGLVKQIKAIDGRMGNVRNAILEGLKDAVWANSQIDELTREREELESRLQSQPSVSEPYQIDIDSLREYFADVSQILKENNPCDCKRVVSDLVNTMVLNPDTGEVYIRYRLPEHLLPHAPDSLGDRGGSVMSYTHKLSR